MSPARPAASLAAVLVPGLALGFVLGLGACAEDSGDAGPIPERSVVTSDPPQPAPSPDPGTTAGELGATDPVDAPRALLVRGIFDGSGRELERLDPAAIVRGPARPPLADVRGIFVLEVTFADGSTTSVPFDALVADDSAGGAAEHGFFEVSAPIEGEVASARVLRADGSVVAEVPIDGADRAGGE